MGSSDKDKDGKDKIPISEPAVLTSEFNQLLGVLSKVETEDTWETHDAALHRLTALVRGGACKAPLSTHFLTHFKDPTIVEKICSALGSERTRLSATALEVLSATARLGPLWESLVSLYIPSVVKLLGRANKLYVTRASGTLRSLIRNTRCSGLVALLAQGIDSPSVSLRLGSAEAVLCCLGGTPEKDVGGSEEWEKVQREGLSVEKAGLDKRNALALGPNGIEGVVRKGGTDKDPKVRSMCKRIWEIYRREWPDRAAAFAKPLTPTVRRVLAIGKDDPLLSAPSAPSGSGTSRSLSASVSTSRAASKPSVHPLSKSTSAAPAAKPAAKLVRPPLPVSSAANIAAVRKAPAEPVASSSSSKPARPVRPGLSSSTSSRTASRVGGLSALGVSTSSSSGAPPERDAHPSAPVVRKTTSTVSLRAVSAPVTGSSSSAVPSRPAPAPLGGNAPSRSAARREPVVSAVPGADAAHRSAARSVLRDGGAGRSTSGWKPMRRGEASAAPTSMAKVPEVAPSSGPEAKVEPAVLPASTAAPPTPAVAATAPILSPPIKAVHPVMPPSAMPTPVPAALAKPAGPEPRQAAEPAMADSAPPPPSKAPSASSTASSTHTVIVKPAQPPVRPAAPARPASTLNALKTSTSSSSAPVRPAQPNGVVAAAGRKPFKPTRATSSTQSSAARAVTIGPGRGQNLPKPGRAPAKVVAPAVAPVAVAVDKKVTEEKEAPAPVEPVVATSVPEQGASPPVVVPTEPAREPIAVVAALPAIVGAAADAVAHVLNDAAPVDASTAEAPRSPSPVVPNPSIADSPPNEPEPEPENRALQQPAAVLEAIPASADAIVIEEESVEIVSSPPSPVKRAEAAEAPPASPPPVVASPATIEASKAIVDGSDDAVDFDHRAQDETEDEVLVVGDTHAPSIDAPSSQLSRTTSGPSLLDMTIAPVEIDEPGGGGGRPSFLGVALITPISPVQKAPSSLPPSVTRASASVDRGQILQHGDVPAPVQPAVDADGSDLLVDFEHEDTVWIPRASSLHGDLVDLAASVPLPPTPPGSSGSRRRSSVVATAVDDSLAQLDMSMAAGDGDQLGMEEEPDRTALGDASLGGLLEGLAGSSAGFAIDLRRRHEVKPAVLPNRLLDEDDTAPIVNPASTDSTTNYDRSLLAAWNGGDDTIDEDAVLGSVPQPPSASAEAEKEDGDRSSTPVPSLPQAACGEPENVDAEAIPPLRRSLRNRGPSKDVVEEEPKSRSRTSTRTRAALAEIQ